jgi:hypothetical protein
MRTPICRSETQKRFLLIGEVLEKIQMHSQYPKPIRKITPVGGMSDIRFWKTILRIFSQKRKAEKANGKERLYRGIRDFDLRISYAEANSHKAKSHVSRGVFGPGKP